MFTGQTLTVEISGIMGAGFLPGLVQSIHKRIEKRYKRLLPNGQTRDLIVRHHIDNSALLRSDPNERQRIAHLINGNPSPDSPEWSLLVEALKNADLLFEQQIDSYPHRVDLALRRGGLLQSYVLLNSPRWLSVAVDRPRPPNLLVFVRANIQTTERSFAEDNELKAVLASDPVSYDLTPTAAIYQQTKWLQALRQVPGVIQVDRTAPDKEILAEEILGQLRASLNGFGLKMFEKTKIFISYSERDKIFSEHLHRDLVKAGIDCWFAPHDIRGGQKIHLQIEDAIGRSDRLVLILSEHSMNSEWVKTEIAHARQKELIENRQVLFPITLVPFERIRDWRCFDSDTGKDSAREVREYFIPDFSRWKEPDSYREQFDRLVLDLKDEKRRRSSVSYGDR